MSGDGVSAGIDSYIAMHFADLDATPSSAEDYVVTAKPASIDNLLALDGVELARSGVALQSGDAPTPLRGVSGGEEAAITVRASPGGRRRLLANAGVTGVHATSRRAVLPVLIQLRNANWNREIEGMRRLTRLGRVVSALVDEQAMKLLAADPDIISVEASRAGGVVECAVSMPWIGAPAIHAAPMGERGAGAIVGLIDDGLDVLHEAFHDANGESRIHWLWDQRDSTGPSPRAVAPGVFDQNYGTLHSRADLTAAIVAALAPRRLGRNPSGHGTHVASIAAGSPLPPDFPGGVAPEADLMVVIPKLAASADDPQSLGYSVTHVEALGFLRAAAEAEGKPIAVNVSLGMNAGAHDGSSALENAFDDFSGGGRDPGFAVIKSAGNEFGEHGHAYVQAFEGGTIPIRWRTTQAPRKEDYLEFWFRSCDDLVFTLQGPGGLALTVDRGAQKASSKTGSFAVYMELTRFHRDNGDGRLTLVVRDNQGGALRQDGDWALEVLGRKVFADGGVHGWVERDTARAVNFATGSVDDLTLSIPGTARSVIAVGACEPNQPLRLSSSSSRGPTRDDRPKPELVAPGVGITAARAGTARGLVPMTGTSMAAPHVTGAVALIFAYRARNGLPQLNGAQLRAALSQALGNYNGRWQAGFGHGRLDLGMLFQAVG
jgi:endonuclease G